MSCQCLKIVFLRNDLEKAENALRSFSAMNDKSANEINSSATALSNNLQCVTPSNLSELLLSAMELDKAPADKIDAMMNMCNFQISRLNTDIEMATAQDRAFHEQARLAAEAESAILSSTQGGEMQYE